MRRSGIPVLAIIWILSGLFSGPVVGEVPGLINYQGKLTDDLGLPLNSEIRITFAIYTQAAGGAAIWSENQAVTISEGIFNVLLGRINPLEPDYFSAYFPAYLGVKVGGDAEMVPRQQIASLAYAMKTAGINLKDGNVGIGTLNPTTKLEVNGVISGVNANPIRQQLVHQRVLYGYTGDSDLTYGNSWTMVRFCYGPFGYAVPPVQPGAIRKFRLYAIYSDNMSASGGETEVWFETLNVVFTLPLTWGGLGGDNRDAYSEWYTGQPSSSHSNIKIRATTSGKSGVLHYLVLQAGDFFE